MDIQALLRELSNQPLTHQLLVGLLKDYKRPNDKILSLKADGLIESVKKGLYIVGRSLGSERPESALLANHILGPSYLYLEPSANAVAMVLICAEVSVSQISDVDLS